MLDGPFKPTPALIKRYKAYCEFFETSRLRGIRKPTPMQFTFAKVYLETRDAELAYNTAGYRKVSHFKKVFRDRAYWRVMQSLMVRELFRLAMFEWTLKTGMSITQYADRLLKIADTAESLSDQVEALRMLNSLLGYDEANAKMRRKIDSYKEKVQYHQERAAA